jgi:hypothetical protein
MRWSWPCIVMICGCVAGPPCDAAQPGPEASATTDITDEVLVRGTRLRELKAAIVAAEDRFYVRYNELNKVDAYDILCALDAHTGTKLKQRRCFTKVQLEAKARNALETLQMFQEQGMGLTGRPPNTDPTAVWLAHFDDYSSNMLYLLKVNPDLRRLARESENAQKRYDAEYKRRLKGRLILIE